MRIDLAQAGSWSQLSDQYRAALAKHHPVFADSAIQVLVYMGHPHALWEVAQSFAKLFSHKKTIAIAGEGEPVFEPIAKEFSEEGYSLKQVTPTEIAANPGWLDQIQTDLLFIAYELDDPITARLKNNSSLLGSLKDKKVFRISVSHACHTTSPLVRPGPFETQILSLSSDRALVLAGERCRISGPLPTLLPWPSQPQAEIQERVSEQFACAQAREKILKFEASLPAGFKAYFGAGDDRIFDRAVIYNPEFDGSAVIDELARVTSLELPSVGQTGPFESTSPCRWENPRMSEWLSQRGDSVEVIGGLILIDAKLITPQLTLQLAQVAKVLRDAQGS